MYPHLLSFLNLLLSGKNKPWPHLSQHKNTLLIFSSPLSIHSPLSITYRLSFLCITLHYKKQWQPTSVLLSLNDLRTIKQSICLKSLDHGIILGIMLILWGSFRARVCICTKWLGVRCNINGVEVTVKDGEVVHYKDSNGEMLHVETGMLIRWFAKVRTSGAHALWDFVVCFMF